MKQTGDLHGSALPFVRRHRAFFTGLFLVVPTLVTLLLLVYTLMKAEFLQGWCPLFIISENSYGLTKGSPVTVSGMTIGHVQDVELIREGVVGVRFKIKRDYQRLIRRDTRARFQQKNIVVGDWTIELTGGTPSASEIVDNDTLQSVAPIRLDRTITQITSMVTLLETMLTGILEGKGTVGRLLTDDSIIELAHGIGSDIERVLAAAQFSLRGADTLINELTLLGRNGGGFIDSLNRITQQVRTALDDAGIVLKNFRDASEDVSPMLREVREDIGEAERMMKTLQRSWIYRQLSGSEDDPLLKGAP